MWRLTQPPAAELPDLPGFLAAINANSDLFDPGVPIAVARAPGRLDLMGGIADYSGALVLELPLACATFAAVQRSEAPAIHVRSLPEEPGARPLEAHVDLAALAPGGVPLDEAAAHSLLTGVPAQAWAAYVIGPLLVLARARGMTINGGLRILVASTVPAGKGVSSSAAIEVAVLRAAAALFGVALEGRELAVLCQRAENLVVGAPCGVMDQMTVACGDGGRLLALRCQPAELEPPVALPEGLAIWGIDSGLRHAVGGSDYGAVRVGAFMGYRIVAELAGLGVAPAGPGRVTVDDPRWGGYLANLTPAEWERRYRDHVPEQIEGAAFLARYGGITDTVTRVDPARTYAVRACAAHPIYEQQRVRLFRALLAGGAVGEEERRLLGELMEQSHASYSACGLGSDGTDLLVDLVREVGAGAGLYGAKITGGGSGGTVAVLARRDSEAAVAEVAARYRTATGRAARVLGGTSPGSMAAGVAWAGWAD